VSQAHEGRAYPGTGDIFASVLLGERMRERSFEDSCRRAADFVATLIRHSSKIATPERMGVALEPDLYLLAERQERE
jgi:pyridoxine kinase